MIPWEIHGSPYVQEHPAKKFAQDADFIGRGWPFGPPVFLGKKRHQNTRRSRVTAPADLEPPRGLELGLGLGLGLRLGSVWSGPTCKVEIDHTPPEQSFFAGCSCTYGEPSSIGAPWEIHVPAL